jgi:hypothetical protein
MTMPVPDCADLTLGSIQGISKINTEPKKKKKKLSSISKVIFLRKGKRRSLLDISGENPRSVCSGRAVWERGWHTHTHTHIHTNTHTQTEIN